MRNGPILSIDEYEAGINEAVDPELVESSIYQISAVKARCNYLIRAIKERSAPAAAADGKEDTVWT